MELQKEGILDKYKVKVLGTPISSIVNTEDRKLFTDELKKIGEVVVPNAAAYNVEEVGACFIVWGGGISYLHKKYLFKRKFCFSLYMKNEICLKYISKL